MKMLLLLWLLPALAWSQDNNDFEALKRRIEQLEVQQEELVLSQRESRSQVQSFLRDNLSIGGFFEAGIATIDGPDTRFQSMFTSSVMGLNLSAEFGNNLRFVNQIITALFYPLQNPQNNPSQSPASREYGNVNFLATVTIGYLEMPLSQSIYLQTGVGYVPFGYAAQQRELVLFLRRGGPQVLRTRNLIQALWAGGHLMGDFSSDNFGFNLYTMNSLDDSNQLGMGGRVWKDILNDSLRIGASAQVMKFGGHTSEIIGGDIRFDSTRFQVTSEYVNHMTGEGRNPWTAYLQPGIKLKGGEFVAFVFTDYSEDVLNNGGSTNIDPVIRWENGVGINWLPTSNTRFRATVAIEDYRGNDSTKSGKNRDYWIFDLSAGVAF